MPLHGYSTDRRPPTTFDHLLAHPYAFMVHGFQMFAGSIVLGAVLFQYPLVTSALKLPRGPLVAMCLVLILGASYVMRGLLDDSNDLRKGFRVERGGLILSGAGWTSFAACVAINNPAAVIQWSMGVFLSAALLLRIIAGRREENRIARETNDLKL